jgi:hypothetical protein
MKKIALVLCVLAATIPNLTAQTTSIHTTGLFLPNKIINAGEDSMLVSEAGTMTANTGRISRIDRATGQRYTLIDGLPSGVNNLGGRRRRQARPA